MRIALLIMSVLSTLGMIFTLQTGLWLYNHDSLLADISNLFNFHRFQAINTVIFTIITFMLVILREITRSKDEPQRRSKPGFYSETEKNV